MTEAIVAAIAPSMAVELSPSAVAGPEDADAELERTIAWRERHAAEIMWGLPPTIGGAVVRMHATVRLLSDSLVRLLSEDPPASKQGNESAAASIAAVSSITSEEKEAVLASAKEAALAAAQLADAALAVCGHTAEEAKDYVPTTLNDMTILDAVCECLPNLLSSICGLLNGMKQNLGAAHLIREPHAEAWVLNQLRLVRSLIFSRCMQLCNLACARLDFLGRLVCRSLRHVLIRCNYHREQQFRLSVLTRLLWVRTHAMQVEGLAESVELISVLFNLDSQSSPSGAIPGESEASLLEQDDERGTVSSRWRDDLGRCIDGWQKALKHARGANWTAVQAWFATWNTRSSK